MKRALKGGLFVAVFCSVLLSASLVSAQTSSNDVVFTLPGGCSSGNINLALGMCSNDGNYFCTTSGNLLTTSTLAGCRGNNATWAGDDCCPTGQECTSNGCVQVTAPCSTYTSMSTCEAHSTCLWWGSSCVSVVGMGCGNYTNKSACEADVYKLGIPRSLGGRGGVLTNRCEDPAYTTCTNCQRNDRTSCKCAWNSTSGACGQWWSTLRCCGSDSRSRTFDCGPVVYSVGPCVDGQQTISWAQPPINPRPSTYVPTADDLLKRGCSSGSYNINCGRPVVRLPAFTMMNFAISIAAIILVYLVFGRKYINNKK